MNIIKLQCMSEKVSIKCADQLLRNKVTHKRLGSAIVALSTMQSSKSISNIMHDFGAHTVDVTDYDKIQLLEV